MNDVILHAFNWRYSRIIEQIDNISNAGFGAILIPPILYSDPDSGYWWQRYQPKDYRILLSQLGTKRELEQIISNAHNKDIRVYADIVINHMANENRDDRYNFPGEKELANYQEKQQYFEGNKLYGNLSDGLFSPDDFNAPDGIDDWTNRDDVVYGELGGLPDLNSNDWVLGQQKILFQKLCDMKFDGFRIDAIKHITEKKIDNIADEYFIKDKYIFGEVLTTNDKEEDVFMDPFLEETHIAAYDFPLFSTIREAFSMGGNLKTLIDPGAYGNAIPWYRSLTFTINHDLPYNDTFRTLMLSSHDEHLANAYILGRDGGVPLIFSDNNESQYECDKDRWRDSHLRYDIIQMIKFHNAVHGQPMVMLYENNDCLIFRRGSKGIVAINKSNYWHNANIWTWGLNNPSKYKCQIHQHEMWLDGSSIFNLAVPPRTAQMWLSE